LATCRAQEPKVPGRALDVLTRGEIDRLDEAASTERDKVIVRLLADTGIGACPALGSQQRMGFRVRLPVGFGLPTYVS